MKLLPWLFLLLCMGGVIWFGRDFVHNAEIGPEDLLASARGRMEATEADPDRARRELNLALSLIEPGERIELVGEILLERARILRKEGNPTAAATDLQTVLQLGLGDEIPVRMELAWVDFSRGELESAEAQVEVIHQQVPSHSSAHLMLAQADYERLDAVRTSVHEQLRKLLPTEAADALLPDIERALLGDLDDPQRSAGTRRLELELCLEDEEEAAGILLALDEGCLLAGQAREHLIRSMDAAIQPRAVQLLSKNFVDAGHPTYAVDLGLAAMAHENVAISAGVLQVLAQALGDLNRPRAATSIAAQAVSIDGEAVPIQPDFLPVWCEILYQGEEWQRLRAIAQQMAAVFSNGPARKEERDSANFYLGIARRNLDEAALADTSLRAYVSASPDEPVVGALGVALRALAEIAAERGEEDFQLKYLLDATVANPEGPGTAWRALASIQLKRSGQSGRAMASMAKAMEVDPGLVLEVEPEWRELGENLLAAAGRDIELERLTLLRQARLIPFEQESSFVLLRLAEAHFAAPRMDGVLATTAVLLDDLPHFAPAIDLRIEALTRLGRTAEALELRLQRIEAGGDVEEHLLDLRERIRTGDLQGAQLYRAMRLDPGNTGRWVFATQMLELGKAAVALRAFRDAGADELSAGSQLLAARSEAASGKLQNALKRLEPLFADPASASEALLIAIEGTLVARRDPQLAKLLKQLPEDVALDPEPALEAVDALLEVGQSAGALQVLARLDSLPETRSGEVLLRMAAAHMRLGSRVNSAEAIERAGAWFGDGRVQLARVLQSVEFVDWTDVPLRVQQLRDTDLELTELSAAILSALEERLDEALALALDGEFAHPQEPLWVLLRLAVQSLRAEPLAIPTDLGPKGRTDAELALAGNERNPRDPRLLLGAMLALEDPVWRAWAAGALDGLRPQDTWSTLILARLQNEAGDYEGASARLAELLELRPGFLPGWVELEEALLGQFGRRDHPELLQARAREALVRTENEGLDEPDALAQADRLTVKAQAQLQKGNLEKATESLRNALALAPDNLGTLQLATTVLIARGDWVGGATSYLRFLQLVEGEERHEALPQLIQIVERGLDVKGLSPVQARFLLDSIEELAPEDPAPPVAIARLDLIEFAERPRLASVRAFAHLDAFRERSDGRPLESLRDGATQEWVALIGRLDPIEAERLVLEELAKDPTEFGLWRALGEVLTVQERQPEALELYDILLQMGPDPEVLLATAELLADAGTDRGRVEALLGQVVQSGARAANDPGAELISAKARLNAGPQSFPGGLQILERLWNGRKKLPAPLVPKLAGLYGMALVRGADPAARGRAREVLEQRLASPSEPLENALLRAMLALSDRIPNPEPAP